MIKLLHFSTSDCIHFNNDFLIVDNQIIPKWVYNKQQLHEGKLVVFCILAEWYSFSHWKCFGHPFKIWLPAETLCWVGVGGCFHVKSDLKHAEDTLLDINFEFLHLNLDKAEVVISADLISS